VEKTLKAGITMILDAYLSIALGFSHNRIIVNIKLLAVVSCPAQ